MPRFTGSVPVQRADGWIEVPVRNRVFGFVLLPPGTDIVWVRWREFYIDRAGRVLVTDVVRSRIPLADTTAHAVEHRWPGEPVRRLEHDKTRS